MHSPPEQAVEKKHKCCDEHARAEIAALKMLIGPFIRAKEKEQRQPGEGGIDAYRS